ncbi:MAG: exodeoxyribonuclease VII small subunit [Solobacterium sp.]|nr:exodeoxyribonuclease VII small subunit [Solobacterium sp.]
MAKKEQTFEVSMNRLQEIVELLEENELPLDEAINLFEEGLHLVKECDTKLKSFETKIEEIKQKSENNE